MFLQVKVFFWFHSEGGGIGDALYGNTCEFTNTVFNHWRGKEDVRKAERRPVAVLIFEWKANSFIAQ